MSTGHTNQSTFVLRGVISHQGEVLTSGHYVTQLVAGERPQALNEIPEHVQGAVMIWACHTVVYGSAKMGSQDLQVMMMVENHLLGHRVLRCGHEGAMPGLMRGGNSFNFNS